VNARAVARINFFTLPFHLISADALTDQESKSRQFVGCTPAGKR
jgi:hypothetical protein